MSSAPYDLSISAARTGALFASPLQRSDEPSARQIRQAIATAIGAHGVRGCAAHVTQAYGEHPETALTRMRWALTAVAAWQPDLLQRPWAGLPPRCARLQPGKPVPHPVTAVADSHRREVHLRHEWQHARPHDSLPAVRRPGRPCRALSSAARASILRTVLAFRPAR